MVQIIKAKEEHFEAIRTLWKGLMDFHGDMDPLYTRSEEGAERFLGYVKGMLESPDANVALAVIDDVPYGYCITMVGTYPPVLKRDKYAYLTDMYVTESYRGIGIGDMLVSDAFKWAKDRGLDRIELRAHSLNDLGIGFWEREGFSEYLKVMYKEL